MTTLTELQDRVKAFLADAFENDPDTTPVDPITGDPVPGPDVYDPTGMIIGLAEKQIEKDLNIDSQRVQETIALAEDDRAFTVPDDTMAIRSVYIDDDGYLQPVWRRQLSYLRSMFTVNDARDRPRVYAVTGEYSYEFAPACDQAYSMKVERDKRMERLSDATPETWISKNFDDLLLAASLKYAAMYADWGSMLQTHQGNYDQLLEGARLEVSRSRRDENTLL